MGHRMHRLVLKWLAPAINIKSIIHDTGLMETESGRSPRELGMGNGRVPAAGTHFSHKHRKLAWIICSCNHHSTDTRTTTEDLDRGRIPHHTFVIGGTIMAKVFIKIPDRVS